MQITEQRFFQVLWVTLAIKLVFAWWIPITGDEAYFILWGKNLDYGYYDHPPMAGWWLAALLQVSDATWWLRLPSVLITTYIGWAIYHLTKKYSQQGALFAGILYLLTPVNLVFVLFTTDTPLILFSFLSAWCFYRAQQADSYHWYLFSGVLLGLAFFSKFFAGLLGIAYFLYLVLFVRRGTRPYIGLLLIIAGTLPFIALNLLWNYNHCWDNYLFNLYNRTSDSVFSLSTFVKYLVVLVYLLTPPVIYYLIRDHRAILRTLKDTSKQVFAALFLIPIGLFFILSFWKVIGLHWVLSFYPFLFIGLSHVFSHKQWRRSLYFMLGYSLIHVLAFAYILVASPGLLKDREDLLKSYVISAYSTELAGQLSKIAPDYYWATGSYGDSSVLSYAARRPVLQFGKGSHHARQDDMLTDYKELDGKNILVLNYADNKNRYHRYFSATEAGSITIAGATYYYVKGKGFNYQTYREEVLEKVMRSYYQIPDFLPTGSCYMFDKYGKPE
ncbi:MAG: glycosyltransferase family 39 protein [Gammaproteobacteria bacterium]